MHRAPRSSSFDEQLVRPTKEKKAAQSLHTAGVDVLGQNVDSPATGQFAESVGVPWVGYDSNAENVRAEVLADRVRLQLGAVLPAAREGAMAGTWKTGFYYGSIKDGFTKLAPYGPSVSAATKLRIAKKMQADRERLVLRVRRSALRPEWQAPACKGQRMTVTDLYGMSWS